jgi:hypothetical protein
MESSPETRGFQPDRPFDGIIPWPNGQSKQEGGFFCFDLTHFLLWNTFVLGCL